MQRILEALNLREYFDLMIGCDHEWFDNLQTGSLNEKLLKITHMFDASVPPQSMLYIDSDVNACEVSRCQIMSVFGVNVLHNLTSEDMLKIQQFF